MDDFRLLGPLEAYRDGERLRLGGPKQRALLALLLLSPGRVVSTERLVDELWGEEAPRTVIASLQNLVSALRKTLGPDLVQTKPPGYLLAVGPQSTDVGRLERLLDAARNGQAADRARALREALALWRGEALGEFADEPFGPREARRLEELGSEPSRSGSTRSSSSAATPLSSPSSRRSWLSTRSASACAAS